MKIRYYISHTFLSTVIIILLAVSMNSCGSNSTSTESSSGGGGSSPTNGSLFESGDLNMGESFSYTFGSSDTTVAYFCRNHISEDMKGKVIVKTGAAISGQDTVIMKNIQFNPSQVTVAPNTKIVWVNHDNEAHTVTNGTASNSGGGGGDDGGGGYGY